MNDAESYVRNCCFGYARVSTDDQELDLQIDALVRYGIESTDTVGLPVAS